MQMHAKIKPQNAPASSSPPVCCLQTSDVDLAHSTHKVPQQPDGLLERSLSLPITPVTLSLADVA